MDVYSYDNVSNTILTIGEYTIPIGGEVVSNGSPNLVLENYVGKGLAKYLNGVLIENYLQYNDTTGAISNGTTNIGVVVPKATGVALTDYTNLSNAITSVGIGGKISLPPNNTYILDYELKLLAGQTLEGNGSTIKLADQVIATLTAPTTINSTTTNVSANFTVDSASLFRVNSRVVIYDTTVEGSTTSTIIKGKISSITNNVVTVQFTNNISEQIATTTDTSTWLETSLTSYTIPIGAKLCTASTLLSATVDNVSITNLILDGNSANNTYGRRWETSPVLNFRGKDGELNNIVINNAMSDGLYHAGIRLNIVNLRINKPCAMGIHLGASTALEGAMYTTITNIHIDSPGMGTPAIGHYGGYNSSHPAYPAIGFSRNTNNVIISDGFITNNYGTISTYGCAISSITAGDNWGITFNNLHISGFNKNLGPLLLARSSQPGGYTSTATDPVGDIKQASSSIVFNKIRFDSCYPTTWATADQWLQCCIGTNFGVFPQFVRIKFTDCEWIDSPMVIQESHVEFGGVNSFIATAVTKSASLTIAGSTSEVDISNVIFRRPVTTSGNVGTEPSWYQYQCHIYHVGGKLKGNNVTIVGGSKGIRVQNGAELDLVNLYAQNQYYYAVLGMSDNTIIGIRESKIILDSSYTGYSGWVGIDLNSGGGVIGNNAKVTVLNTLIDAYTTNSGQWGIRLPTNSTVKSSISGCKIKISGTSTTSIYPGSTTGISVVTNNLLSHTYTPGAAETSAYNTVSTNI